jgi:HEAT repeat protein
MDALAFADRPKPLASWCALLGEALDAPRPLDAEAVRYAVRQRFLDADEDVVPRLLDEVTHDGARAEIIPLWVDARGLPDLGTFAAWIAGRPVRVRAAAYFRLARLGRDGRQALARLLPGDDEQAGSDALAWLLRREGRGAIDVAVASPATRHALVRTALAAAMVTPEDPSLQQALRDFLAWDLPFRIREAVADALGATYPERLRSTPADAADLFARAQRDDPIIRSLVLREAGDFMDQWKQANPDPGDVLRVRDLVRTAIAADPDPLVRRAAVMSRVGIRPDIKNLAEQCHVLLEAAGNDPDPGVRAAVIRRIHRGCAHARPPFGPSYLTPYIEGDPDPDVRREGLRTLPRYAGLDPWSEEARGGILRALRDDPDPAVRLEAAALLTDFGWEDAAPHLLDAAAHDTDARFRDALFDALRDQVGDADPDFVRALARLDPRWEAKGLPVDPEPREEGSPIRLVPDFRQVSDELPILDNAGEPGEPPPPEDEPAGGWRTSEVEIPTGDGGPTLRGLLTDRVDGETTPLLVIVPGNPLLGGAPSALSATETAHRARDAGWATLRFDYRGRGGSEGCWGGIDGCRMDVAAAIAFATDARRRSGVTPTSTRPPMVTLVSFGPGVQYIAPESLGVAAHVPIDPRPETPSSPRAAYTAARRQPDRHATEARLVSLLTQPSDGR